MPGDGLTHGPRAVKKHGEGTTGAAGSSGIPCATVLQLIARSPWEPGFLAPIASEIISRRLGLSVGRPGPHDFAVREGHARRARPTRPSQPASRSLTIGQNALYNRGGMVGRNHIFLENGSQIFFARGLDNRISLESPHEIRFFAQAMLSLRPGLTAAKLAGLASSGDTRSCSGCWARWISETLRNEREAL
jgi:hypothetical protein